MSVATPSADSGGDRSDTATTWEGATSASEILSDAVMKPRDADEKDAPAQAIHHVHQSNCIAGKAADGDRSEVDETSRARNDEAEVSAVGGGNAVGPDARDDDDGNDEEGEEEGRPDADAGEDEEEQEGEEEGPEAGKGEGEQEAEDEEDDNAQENEEVEEEEQQEEGSPDDDAGEKTNESNEAAADNGVASCEAAMPPDDGGQPQQEVVEEAATRAAESPHEDETKDGDGEEVEVEEEEEEAEESDDRGPTSPKGTGDTTGGCVSGSQPPPPTPRFVAGHAIMHWWMASREEQQGRDAADRTHDGGTSSAWTESHGSPAESSSSANHHHHSAPSMHAATGSTTEARGTPPSAVTMAAAPFRRLYPHLALVCRLGLAPPSLMHAMSGMTAADEAEVVAVRSEPSKPTRTAASDGQGNEHADEEGQLAAAMKKNDLSQASAVAAVTFSSVPAAGTTEGGVGGHGGFDDDGEPFLPLFHVESVSKPQIRLFNKHDAAKRIQTAHRGFVARKLRANRATNLLEYLSALHGASEDDEEEGAAVDEAEYEAGRRDHYVVDDGAPGSSSPQKGATNGKESIANGQKEKRGGSSGGPKKERKNGPLQPSPPPHGAAGAQSHGGSLRPSPGHGADGYTTHLSYKHRADAVKSASPPSHNTTMPMVDGEYPPLPVLTNRQAPVNRARGDDPTAQLPPPVEASPPAAMAPVRPPLQRATAGARRAVRVVDDPLIVELEAKIRDRRAKERQRLEETRKKQEALQELFEKRQKEIDEQTHRQRMDALRIQREATEKRAEEMRLLEEQRQQRLSKLLKADMDVITGKKSIVEVFQQRFDQQQALLKREREDALKRRHEQFGSHTGPKFYEMLAEHEKRVAGAKEERRKRDHEQWLHQLQAEREAAAARSGDEGGLPGEGSSRSAPADGATGGGGRSVSPPAVNPAFVTRAHKRILKEQRERERLAQEKEERIRQRLRQVQHFSEEVKLHHSPPKPAPPKNRWGGNRKAQRKHEMAELFAHISQRRQSIDKGLPVDVDDDDGGGGGSTDGATSTRQPQPPPPRPSGAEPGTMAGSHRRQVNHRPRPDANEVHDDDENEEREEGRGPRHHHHDDEEPMGGATVVERVQDEVLQFD